MAAYHLVLENFNLKQRGLSLHTAVQFTPHFLQITACFLECFPKAHNCSVRLSRTTRPTAGWGKEVRRGEVAPRMAGDVRSCDRTSLGAALLGLEHFLLG